MKTLADVASQLALHSEVRRLLDARTVFQRCAAIGAIGEAAHHIHAAAERHRIPTLANLAYSAILLAEQEMATHYEDEQEIQY